MYNRVILMGRLTVDPELKQTPSGVSVTSFSIAVDRPYGKGEKQTDFIDIVAWRHTAEFICRYFSKGKLILVEGSIQVRSYTDKNDNKRRAWEVVADQARFTGEKKSIDIEPEHTPENVDDFDELDSGESLPF